MVERAYTDATDGAPALNTLPGPFASKVTCKVMVKRSDAYSTTAELECHAVCPVEVGVDAAMPYHEVIHNFKGRTETTCNVGVKAGALTKLVILAEAPCDTSL